MARRPATERVRFTARSLLVAVGMFGATLAGLKLFASASRIVGWVLTATVIAAVLYPLVAGLARWIPRSVAVLVVLLVTIGSLGLVTWAMVDTIVRENKALQVSAPAAAAQLEQSPRYGDLARKLKLEQQTAEFVKSVPERLRGGDTAAALKAAATRGVAFLATGVLSLFFLLHGPRLLNGGFLQLRDPIRRRRYQQMATRAYRRAWIYTAGTGLMAVAAGVVAYVTARLANVPGPAALGVWAALWDVIPLIGGPIGALPVVLLALILGSTERGIAVLAVFVLYHVLEGFVLQPRLEARSIHVGAFLTIVGGVVGVELYGIGGGLLAIALLTFASAVLAEIVPPLPQEEAGTPEVADLVEGDHRANAAS
jgi:putative heme transporter